MPHGALILDPRNFGNSSTWTNRTDAAFALHYAALEAGRFVQELEAEVLLLLTPHGLALPRAFVLYDNPTAEGSVDVGSWLPCSFPPCSYAASAAVSTPLTQRLDAALRAGGAEVTTISAFGPPGNGSLPLPLGWAEVIPLWFIDRAYDSTDDSKGGVGGGGGGRGQRGSGSAPSGRGPGEGDGVKAEAKAEGAAGGGVGAAAAAREERWEAQSGVSGWRRRAAEQQRRQLNSRRSAVATADAKAAESQDRIRATRSRSRTDASSGSANGRSSKSRSRSRSGPMGSMPDLMIMGMPSRRYEHAATMVSELLTLGHDLFRFLDPLDERIAIVVSADLAHTWDPHGPYGWSAAAEKFDAAAALWAREMDREALLRDAARAVGEAKSCGFPGLVILQGLIDKVKPDNLHNIMLECGHPSYYGMMAAIFDFQGDA